MTRCYEFFHFSSFFCIRGSLNFCITQYRLRNLMVVPRQLGEGSDPAQPQFVDERCALYEPLQYPLLYPTGTRGWSIPIGPNPCCYSTQRQRITFEWWCRQLMLRCDQFFFLGRLVNEWLVDMWSRQQNMKFNYIRTQLQANIRASRNALQNAPPNTEVGARCMMPSSIPGSKGYQRKLALDGMALASRRGAPSLFITVTCNPR